MMKKSQLIAVGFIFFGLILFAASVFLIAKEYFTTQTTVANYAPVSQPVNIPTVNANKKTPTPKPTKEPTATPVPVVPSTVKQIAYNSWLVSLNSEKWFDTSIPVIANDTVNITTPQKEKIEGIQYRLNDKNYFSTDGRQVYMFEEYGIDAGFKDTLKLKLMEGTASQNVLVTISPNVGKCLAYNDAEHRAKHDTAVAWADGKKSK